jgi:quercetin 2,3-dioxygenase
LLAGRRADSLTALWILRIRLYVLSVARYAIPTPVLVGVGVDLLDMEAVFHLKDSRGKAEHGWLSSRFSFSFANWYEPSRMGFGALRVLNDDTIAPASGFGMHPHANMEIITIVTKGAVTHEDSMGNKGVVHAGEVQVMTAGTGVVHAEKNDSETESLELFQLWITPREAGLLPRYEQRMFDASTSLLVSPDGREGSLSIMQDAFIERVSLSVGEALSQPVRKSGNGLYIFVVSGSTRAGDITLGQRDALGIRGVSHIQLLAEQNSELLIIEVPVVD